MALVPVTPGTLPALGTDLPLALLVGDASFRRRAAEELGGAFTVRHAGSPEIARALLPQLKAQLVVAHADSAQGFDLLSDLYAAHPRVARILVAGEMAEIFATFDPHAAIQLAIQEPWRPGQLRAAAAIVVAEEPR